MSKKAEQETPDYLKPLATGEQRWGGTSHEVISSDPYGEDLKRELGDINESDHPYVSPLENLGHAAVNEALESGEEDVQSAKAA